MWVRVYEEYVMPTDAPAPTFRHRLLVHVHELLSCAERSDLVSDPLELLHVLRAADRDRCAIVSDRWTDPVYIRLI